MGVLGYNAEKHLQVIQDESFDDGVKVGIDKRDAELDELYTWLFANNRGSDVQKASSDSEYKKKLFDEFGELKK